MTSISRFLRRMLPLSVAAIPIVSCGPSLTTPSSTNISGTWVSPGPAAGMTNMSITLTQAPDGSLTGTYTATGTSPLQFCPASGPCAISGGITGVSNVFQVFFYLQDAGTFTGQVMSEGAIRGAMQRISTTEPVQFNRP